MLLYEFEVYCRLEAKGERQLKGSSAETTLKKLISLPSTDEQLLETVAGLLFYVHGNMHW